MGSEARGLARAFYDLPRLLELRRLLESLDPAGPPRAHFLVGEAPAQGPLAVLPGSFNPLTRAHIALARTARRRLGLERVFFALSGRIVDKEEALGACLEDRLLLLSRYCARHPGYGVLVFNRGLYVEQAEALVLDTQPARAYGVPTKSKISWGAPYGPPEGKELLFLVGVDKLPLILDPRYYDDREEALGRLFARATLVVAPRWGLGWREYRSLLARPENRAFASRVRWLPLPPRYRRLAATQVRRELAQGCSAAPYVPREAQELIRQTGAYGPPEPPGEDPYAQRLALLDRLSRAMPEAPGREGDLRGLVAGILAEGGLEPELSALLRRYTAA